METSIAWLSAWRVAAARKILLGIIPPHSCLLSLSVKLCIHHHVFSGIHMNSLDIILNWGLYEIAQLKAFTFVQLGFILWMFLQMAVLNGLKWHAKYVNKIIILKTCHGRKQWWLFYEFWSNRLGSIVTNYHGGSFLAMGL